MGSPRRSPRIERQRRVVPPSGAAVAHVRETARPEVHSRENPFVPPGVFNKKIGLNAIVLCRLDWVFPKKPLREHFLNNYVKNKMRFKVVGLERRTITGKKFGIVLMLEFMNDSAYLHHIP